MSLHHFRLIIAPLVVVAACAPVVTGSLPVEQCSTDADCDAASECRLPDDGSCFTANCPAGATCPPVCDGKRCQPRRAPDAGATDGGLRDGGAADAGAGLCASVVAPCRSDFDCRSTEACLPPVDRRCAPSACGPCDPATGTAQCTKDCNGRICQRRPDADGGANQCAGFEPPCRSDAQCGPGRACLRDENQCNPSVCLCDPATGGITCTEDCGGGICGRPSPDAGATDGGACLGFRPPCAADTDCVRGEACVRSAGVCRPSACACGPSGITCTADCGGGVCEPRDAGVVDAGAADGGFCVGFVPPCSSDAQCGPGNRCARDPNQCTPSACGCDPTTGDVICTADCGGGRCTPQTPDAGGCQGFEPPCSTSAACGPGRSCQRDPRVCLPSACACDPVTGAIICTADCNGGVCAAPVDAGTPDAGLCANFDPPCTSNAQCRPGTTCRSPPNACTPSACGCDPATGNIRCTADCGGRRCLP